MITRTLALLGLAGTLFAGCSVPVLAQAGSPNSCQYLEQNNPVAYAQLCGAGTHQTPDATDPVLGDDTPDQPSCAAYIPHDFPAGMRVHIATPCPY